MHRKLRECSKSSTKSEVSSNTVLLKKQGKSKINNLASLLKQLEVKRTTKPQSLQKGKKSQKSQKK